MLYAPEGRIRNNLANMGKSHAKKIYGTESTDVGGSTIKAVIRSLGLVFGDIGTSPIYTLSVIFLLTQPSADRVIGVLSLIIWTLPTLVSVEYAWLAMSLGEKARVVLSFLRRSSFRCSREAAALPLFHCWLNRRFAFDRRRHHHACDQHPECRRRSGACSGT